jgi:hypothetical protein
VNTDPIPFSFAGIPATYCTVSSEILIDGDIIPLSEASSLLREAALSAVFAIEYDIQGVHKGGND